MSDEREEKIAELVASVCEYLEDLHTPEFGEDVMAEKAKIMEVCLNRLLAVDSSLYSLYPRCPCTLKLSDLLTVQCDKLRAHEGDHMSESSKYRITWDNKEYMP